MRRRWRHLPPRSGSRSSHCCARWAETTMDAVPATDTPTLGFGFRFADLATREGLVRLGGDFLGHLAAEDALLHARLLAARAAPDALAAKEESDLVVALGPHLDGF